MTVLAGTRAFLGQTLTLLIVLFFLLADGDALLRRFVEILPGFAEKKRAVQIAIEVERNISGYLATITLMNLLVGVANGAIDLGVRPARSAAVGHGRVPAELHPHPRRADRHGDLLLRRPVQLRQRRLGAGAGRASTC